MSGLDRNPSEYRTARIASAFLCFGVAGVLSILDALRADFEVNPLVVFGLLAIGAGLLGVDVPAVRSFFSFLKPTPEEPSVREYECPICGRIYQSPSALGHHVRRVHPGTED